MRAPRRRSKPPIVKSGPIGREQARSRARRMTAAYFNSMDLVNKIPSMFHGASAEHFPQIAVHGLKAGSVVGEKSAHDFVFTAKPLLAAGYAESKQHRRFETRKCEPTLEHRGMMLVHVKSKTPAHLRRDIIVRPDVTKYKYVPPKFLEVGVTYTSPEGSPLQAYINRFVRARHSRLPKAFSPKRMLTFENNISILTQFYSTRMRSKILKAVGKVLRENKSVTVNRTMGAIEPLLRDKVNNTALKWILARGIAENVLPDLCIEGQLRYKKIRKGDRTDVVFYRRRR